jgi:hypothetical protein
MIRMERSCPVSSEGKCRVVARGCSQRVVKSRGAQRKSRKEHLSKEVRWDIPPPEGYPGIMSDWCIGRQKYAGHEAVIMGFTEKQVYVYVGDKVVLLSQRSLHRPVHNSIEEELRSRCWLGFEDRIEVVCGKYKG